MAACWLCVCSVLSFAERAAILNAHDPMLFSCEVPHRSERFLAVPEIVFEIVHIGFEHVERLVLHLPSCPPARGQFRHGAGRDRQVCDIGVVVGPFTLAVQSFDREPIDRQRVFRATYRHFRQPTVNRCRAFAADDRGLAMFFQFGAFDIFGDGSVRRWLAGENEVPARLLDGFGDGPAGEQSVAEKDWPDLRAVADPGLPSLCPNRHAAGAGPPGD